LKPSSLLLLLLFAPSVPSSSVAVAVVVIVVVIVGCGCCLPTTLKQKRTSIRPASILLSSSTSIALKKLT
jgi:hypothetical protein